MLNAQNTIEDANVPKTCVYINKFGVYVWFGINCEANNYVSVNYGATINYTINRDTVIN